MLLHPHVPSLFPLLFFFFFNDTATTEIYTLSLHDALPICMRALKGSLNTSVPSTTAMIGFRSEEHTSELQSPVHLVCRLLLEKKKIHSRPPVKLCVLSKARGSLRNSKIGARGTFFFFFKNPGPPRI